MSERRRHPGSQRFRGSMAGLYAPLPTLRRRPRGRLRTARGRCGSLLLHRSGLAPQTPCRSPGALTRVAARTLARSPIRDPLYRRPGWDSHPLESAAFSRRTPQADGRCGADRDPALRHHPPKVAVAGAVIAIPARREEPDPSPTHRSGCAAIDFAMHPSDLVRASQGLTDGHRAPTLPA